MMISASTLSSEPSKGWKTFQIFFFRPLETSRSETKLTKIPFQSTSPFLNLPLYNARHLNNIPLHINPQFHSSQTNSQAAESLAKSFSGGGTLISRTRLPLENLSTETSSRQKSHGHQLNRFDCTFLHLRQALRGKAIRESY